MLFFYKLLILFIVILFTYLLFRLVSKRKQLLSPPLEGMNASKSKSNDGPESDDGPESKSKESFTDPETSELDSFKKVTEGPGVRSVDILDAYLPLREYAIKASYNSAVTGKYVSLDAIKHVISRGARFLDFEVYMIDNNLYVAQSNDASYKTIDSDNKILLDDVLSTTVISGFTAPCPNPEDPLFIQLRIKSANTEIYKKVAMSIDNNLKHKLYRDASGKIAQVDPNVTMLSDIMGKVIMVIDKIVAPEYDIAPSCPPPVEKSKLCANPENKKSPLCNIEETPCYNLTKYANMISGSESLFTYSFESLLKQTTSPVNINDDKKTTDVTKMKIALPDIDNSNVGNPDAEPLIRDHGVQIICYRFYKKDANFTKYEKLFKDAELGIVPLAKIVYILQISVLDRSPNPPKLF